MTQSGHYAAQRRELRVYTVCTWVHMLMELLFIWGHYPHHRPRLCLQASVAERRIALPPVERSAT